MQKGIFWAFITVKEENYEYPELKSILVECDINGNILEEADFTSKSGDNFNHKIEWEKYRGFRAGRNKPFDYYPRGRVEIKNGKIRIYAHPCLIENEMIRNMIIQTFELEDVKDDIQWIADNSSHYQSIYYSLYNDL